MIPALSGEKPIIYPHCVNSVTQWCQLAVIQLVVIQVMRPDSTAGNSSAPSRSKRQIKLVAQSVFQQLSHRFQPQHILFKRSLLT